MEKNTLLKTSALPLFSKMKKKDMFPAIKYLVDENKSIIKKIENLKAPTWNNLVYKLEESDDKISKAWAPIRHLNSVMNDKEIRAQYEKSLNLLTSHYGKIGQNKKLFSQYEKLYEQNRKNLTQSQNKLLENVLRGFRLSGVHLNVKKRKLFRECQEKLAKLESKFEQNILDSSNSWAKNFKTIENLKGMPQSSLEIAEETAAKRNEVGYT